MRTRVDINGLYPIPKTLHPAQVLIASGPGDAFHNIGAQLEDGHWVLSFANTEDAKYATSMVDKHVAKLRAFYCAVRPPPLLLTGTPHRANALAGNPT